LNSHAEIDASLPRANFFFISGVAVSAGVYAANISRSRLPYRRDHDPQRLHRAPERHAYQKPERNGRLPSINGTDNCLVSYQFLVYDPSEVIDY
jgi:hypothetical protein